MNDKHNIIYYFKFINKFIYYFSDPKIVHDNPVQHLKLSIINNDTCKNNLMRNDIINDDYEQQQDFICASPHFISDSCQV